MKTRLLSSGAALLLVAGCGGSGEVSSPSASPSPSVAADVNAGATPAAEAVGPRLANVDAIFEDLAAEGGPGCAVGVSKNGAWVHRAGYGYANLDYKIPIDGDSIFRIGSVSKQFTAAAVAIAAEEGLFDLDDPIRDYLTDIHPGFADATIRQIIGHISGAPDYEDGGLNDLMTGALGAPVSVGNEDFFTIEEFYDVTKKVEPFAPPGDTYRYSNIGYFWLSMLIEETTGETLRAYADRKIFKPAGMTASFFNDNANGVVRRRASGYQPLEDGGYEVFETNLDWVGDGGVYTSVNDFFSWIREFEEPGIGADPAALRARLLEPITDYENDEGEARQYAFGVDRGVTESGTAFIGHGGSWVGFRAFFRHFPARGAYWILCNRSDASPGRYADAMDAVLLEE